MNLYKNLKMKNTKVKKKKQLSEDDSNQFAIMFTLINSEEPLTLSEISKKIELQPNLTFYHINVLKEKNLIIESSDKKYDCQPIFQERPSEDLDMLMMLIIRLIAHNLVIDNPSEKQLSDAVLENLRTYMEIYELEITE